MPGYLDLLTLLSSPSCAQLVITCRDDVWDVAYKSDLPFAVERLEEIDDHRLGGILSSHGSPSEATQNPLLRIPFFLDLAIRNKAVWSSIPSTAIEFLKRVFREVRQEIGSRPTPLGRRKEEIVHALARLQVTQLSYEIPRPAVEEACNLGSGAFRQALAELKHDRIVSERTPSALPELRRLPRSDLRTTCSTASLWQTLSTAHLTGMMLLAAFARAVRTSLDGRSFRCWSAWQITMK